MEIKSLSQQIYELLRERILDGQYAFGEKLNIDTICKELAVSNSPVREALSLLTANHLANRKTNAGTYVVEFTPESYNEVAESFSVLILGAYDICCIKERTGLLVRYLNEQVQNLEKCIESGSDRTRMKAILQIDRCFVMATENQRCIRQFDSEADLVYLAYIYNHAGRVLDWNTNLEHHRNLVRAVQDNKYKTVQKILGGHTHSHIL